MKQTCTSAVCLAVAMAVGACDASNTGTGGFAGSPGLVLGNGGSGPTATLLNKGGSATGGSKSGATGGTRSTSTTPLGTGGVTSTGAITTFAQACNTICTRRIAMACATDEGMTMSDCLLACSDTTDVPAECLPVVQSFTICMANMPASGFECDIAGDFAPITFDACADQIEALMSCSSV